MSQKELEKVLKKNKLDIKDFYRWMDGQTYGINDDGSPDWYDHDVNRFIHYRTTGQKEPWWIFD